MGDLRPIMFVGTGSDVGKSILCTGLCRIFKQDGYAPAPFKAQNMSLNSFPTPEGAEIGRAQVAQAEAAGVAPHSDMNPVLLKPTGDQASQVVLHGKAQGDLSARDYFEEENRDFLFQEVVQALHRLQERYAPIVIEGAGSISELNLKDRDITNMRIAQACDAATYLVADIDKGGIFGSVHGSVDLLEPEERKQLEGIVVNKFRGDKELFESGKQKLEELTGLPVIGVLPYFKDVDIDEEDSVSLTQKGKTARAGAVNVLVLLLEHLSNFTDFSRLERDGRVHLYYSDSPEAVKEADIVIIPGSKNTVADLLKLREKGLVQALLHAYDEGKKLIGICGGYQMLGRSLEDPDRKDGSVEQVPGIGLLPIHTRAEPEKVTEQCRFAYKGGEFDCEGYEIHMGRSEPLAELSSLNRIEGKGPEGCWLNDACWGTYLHGILDNQAVIDDLLGDLTERKAEEKDPQEYKEEQYERLAEHLRTHLDLERVYRTIQR